MAGRKRDPALDEAIRRAAAAVLAETGYTAFTIETIADHLSIPKSTIYKRWSSRSELLAHVLSRRMAMMGAIDPDTVGDLRQALIDCVTEEISLSRTREGRAIAQGILAARDDEAGHLDELVAAGNHRRANYRLLLERGLERRELPGDADLDLLLDLLLGSVWAAVLWGQPREEADAPRLVDAVLAAVPRRGSS